jgi:hypothetical protein
LGLFAVVGVVGGRRRGADGSSKKNELCAS